MKTRTKCKHILVKSREHFANIFSEKYFLISGERRKYFCGKMFSEKPDKKNRFSGSSISSRFSSSFSSSRVVTTGHWTMPCTSNCILSYYISFCHIVICYISLYHIMNYYAISSYSLNNSLRTPDYNRLQCRKFCIHVSAFLLHRCITLSRSCSQVLEEFIQGVPEKNIPLK